MNQEPLGLPQGSVRAALAVGLTATICVMFILGSVIPDALMILVTAADAYYFAARSNAPAPVTPEPVLAEPFVENA